MSAEPTAVRSPGTFWREARLVEAHAETATARTLVLEVAGWAGHRPGQHVDIRLTAEDGYTATRSYSLSAPADGERLVVTVERFGDGEVSPFLVEQLAVEDAVEIRGPIGRWFVWRPDLDAPVLLLGGGSGVAPLMAMLRAHRASGVSEPMRLLYSARTPGDVYYRDELGADDATVLYTRVRPEGTERAPRRLDADDLGELDPATVCFVCGPSGFVEHVTGLLVTRGHDEALIRTERFGPTG